MKMHALLKTRIQFQTTLAPLEKDFLQKAAKQTGESLANFLRESALRRAAMLLGTPWPILNGSKSTSARRSPRIAR